MKGVADVPAETRMSGGGSILDLVVWFKARGLCEYYWKISNADDYIDETGTFATFINLLEEPLSDCF